MTYTIAVTAPTLSESGVAVLKGAGARVLMIPPGGAAADVERLLSSEPVDAVISRTVMLSGKAIESCPTLKVICKHGVGTDNIDVATATRRNIPVLITAAGNSQAVAELAIGLLLAVARRIPLQDGSIRCKDWDRTKSGLELSGRVLGLVGVGEIGRRVAAAARGLGMRVVGFDTAPVGASQDVERMEDLNDLLDVANVLSLHCPLNEATRGLISDRELARLPQDAIVINTARGGILDEAALARAIASGNVFGAGIDCFQREPIPADSPLLSLSEVVMTAHMGGSTKEALAHVARTAAQQVIDALNARPIDPAICVNPQTLANRTA
ncbi:hypothetical protein UP09_05485 [Bradyrhizobium sp. LTSP885]|uniref:hydroxyacid dehydrogenase n=1 Tax=Bradyrhizobium sp. LTSP885 TaxID=1619232 RepID=UPI0005C9A003|nr:hydroxyacid dehydrogenase [Bradyrhizobium sp. LTSP885]KJC50461.1 hypothetical protein UP09_05485 [Bradyrhizobium sp. LTSP885]